jgi:hypothetical protein
MRIALRVVVMLLVLGVSGSVMEGSNFNGPIPTPNPYPPQVVSET